MLRQEENTGVFILGQCKRNLHSGRSGNTSKGLMGCFQPLAAAAGGLLEGFAKGHQPKLHLHPHLLLPRAAHLEGTSSSSSYCRKSRTCREQRSGRHLNHLKPSHFPRNLKPYHCNQGVSTRERFQCLSSRWCLQTGSLEIIQSSTDVIVQLPLTAVLFWLGDTCLVTQMEIPLWKNVLARCRGDGPALSSLQM